MRSSRWRGFALLAAMALAAPAAALFGEDSAPRATMPELVAQLRSVLSVERSQAIRACMDITEKDVVRDFKLVDLLLETAKDSRQFASVRGDALKALANFSVRALADQDLLKPFGSIIADKKDLLEVRIEALHQLGSMALPTSRKSNVVDQEKLIKAAKDLLVETAITGTNEAELRVEAVRALGKMGKAGSVETMRKLLLDSNVKVKIAAIEGIRAYVQQEKPEITLAHEIVSALTSVKSDAPGATELKTAAISCLEAMMSGGYKLTDAKVVDLLLASLASGGSEEATAAARCLLRIDDPKETRITEAFLKAVGEPSKAWNAKAITTMVMGLIEQFRLLQAQYEAKPTDGTAAKQAATIVELLAKMVKSAKLSATLKDIGITGLGIVPLSFDRDVAVGALIDCLDDSKSVEVVEDILERYTRKQPFRTPFDDKPDVAAWKDWLEKNKDSLKAGKAPWLEVKK